MSHSLGRIARAGATGHLASRQASCPLYPGSVGHRIGPPLIQKPARDVKKPGQSTGSTQKPPRTAFNILDLEGLLSKRVGGAREFASTLRRVRYPFDSQQSATSVEIYHTGHNLLGITAHSGK
jgi:hypothetical protein